VLLGHLQIQGDQVRPVLGGHGQALLAAGGHQGLVALVLEDVLQVFGDVLFVLDDQYFLGHLDS